MGALPLTTAQRAFCTAVMQRLAQLHDAVPVFCRARPASLTWLQEELGMSSRRRRAIERSGGKVEET